MEKSTAGTPGFEFFDRSGPPMESVRDYLQRKRAERIVALLAKVFSVPGAVALVADTLEKALAPSLVQCVMATVETLQEEGLIPKPPKKRKPRKKKGGQ